MQKKRIQNNSMGVFVCDIQPKEKKIHQKKRAKTITLVTYDVKRVTNSQAYNAHHFVDFLIMLCMLCIEYTSRKQRAYIH